MMTGVKDEVLNLMEEYIKITELINDFVNGNLKIILDDGKGHRVDLDDLITTDAIDEQITGDLTHYQADLAEQIKEELE